MISKPVEYLHVPFLSTDTLIDFEQLFLEEVVFQNQKIQRHSTFPDLFFWRSQQNPTFWSLMPLSQNDLGWGFDGKMQPVVLNTIEFQRRQISLLNELLRFPES